MYSFGAVYLYCIVLNGININPCRTWLFWITRLSILFFLCIGFSCLIGSFFFSSWSCHPLLSWLPRRWSCRPIWGNIWWWIMCGYFRDVFGKDIFASCAFGWRWSILDTCKVFWKYCRRYTLLLFRVCKRVFGSRRFSRKLPLICFIKIPYAVI